MGYRLNGVNPTGTQEDKARAVRFAFLQQVHSAREVVLHQLPAARLAICPSQHAGIRGAIYNPIHSRQSVHITLTTQIAMKQLYAQPPQLPAVHL